MDNWQRMQTEREQVVLVDSSDQVIGQINKIEAHQKTGHLHRALTVFLSNPSGQILTTQRSSQKPLWPLWWDAAASTHQWPGESDQNAAARRLPFEIGLKVPAPKLKLQFTYEYHAVYNQDWSENEINYIFTGVTDQQPQINQAEVKDFAWKSPAEIDKELKNPNHRYAPWFLIAWKRLRDNKFE